MLKSTLLLIFCAAAATAAALPNTGGKAVAEGTPAASGAAKDGSSATVEGSGDELPLAVAPEAEGSGDAPLKPDGPSEVAVKGPFTKHFLDFLKKDANAKEYVVDIAYEQHKDDFGSFGGKTAASDKVTKRPVIFIHGNSDYALRREHVTLETGWSNTVAYFKEKGYTGAELYGLTYGSGNVTTGSLKNSITCEYAKTHRYFIDAILKYTGQPKVDVIAHSMGATIARMVLQGGIFKINGTDCDLGVSLKDKVRTLLSISGAHYGMCLCLKSELTGVASCGDQGFKPGQLPNKEQTVDECLHYEASDEERANLRYSDLLEQVNKRSVGNKEAERIVSIFSKDDDILGEGNKAWGKQTSVPPGNDLVKEFAVYDHFQTKDFTAATQFYLVSFDKL